MTRAHLRFVGFVAPAVLRSTAARISVLKARGSSLSPARMSIARRGRDGVWQLLPPPARQEPDRARQVLSAANVLRSLGFPAGVSAHDRDGRAHRDRRADRRNQAGRDRLLQSACLHWNRGGHQGTTDANVERVFHAVALTMAHVQRKANEVPVNNEMVKMKNDSNLVVATNPKKDEFVKEHKRLVFARAARHRTT